MEGGGGGGGGGGGEGWLRKPSPAMCAEESLRATRTLLATRSQEELANVEISPHSERFSFQPPLSFFTRSRSRSTSCLLLNYVNRR